MSEKVLVVGSTGFLGGHIAQACYEQGKDLHVLIRPQTLQSSDAEITYNLECLVSNGATVHAGDLKDSESLRKACAQVDYVISAVGGDCIRDQLKLVQTVASVGNIKRFIPSDFGVDVWLSRPYSCPMFDCKRQIQQEIERNRLPHTFIYGNGFMSYWVAGLGTIGLVEPPKQEVTVYGTGDVSAAMVDEADVARFTVATLDDPRTLDCHLSIMPPLNLKSQNELVRLWQERSGATLQRCEVSAAELESHIRQFENPEQEVKCWILQIIQSVWIRGEAGFLRDGVLEATELYPDIDYTTVAETMDRFLTTPE